METTIALKEWAIVAQAMGTGDQIILLRKGGILDPNESFNLEHREFLIYPSVEHQKKDWIRAPFQQKYSAALQAAAADTVSFQVYAGVAHHAEIKNPAVFTKLEKYHVWTPEFFTSRKEYHPHTPLILMIVRAYRLPKTVQVPAEQEYAGCKSWVNLRKPVSVDGAEPVIENRKFRAMLEEIREVCG